MRGFRTQRWREPEQQPQEVPSSLRLRTPAPSAHAGSLILQHQTNNEQARPGGEESRVSRHALKHFIEIIDARDLSAPFVAGVIQRGGVDIACHDALLFIADDGIEVYSAEVPSVPRQLSSWHAPGKGQWIDQRNGVAQFIGQETGSDGPINTLYIVDISEPETPRQISCLVLPSRVSPNSIRIEGTRTFVSDDTGFTEIGTRDPLHPVVLGSYKTFHRPVRTEVFREHLFAAAGMQGLLSTPRSSWPGPASWISPSEVEITVPRGMIPGPYHVVFTDPEGNTTAFYNALRVYSASQIGVTVDAAPSVGAGGLSFPSEWDATVD